MKYKEYLKGHAKHDFIDIAKDQAKFTLLAFPFTVIITFFVGTFLEYSTYYKN